MDLSAPATPRRPSRSNGVERYHMLTAAAKRLMEKVGSEAVTIKAIAEEAGVPMASVYHFFPTPTAACVAVSETYLAEIAELIGRSVPKRSADDVNAFIVVLMRRMVNWYRRNPTAMKLMLGSDYRWNIRLADLENNRGMAASIASRIARRFALREDGRHARILNTAISIGDAVWSLSMAEDGAITPYYAGEAERAVTAYLDTAFAPGGAAGQLEDRK